MRAQTILVALATITLASADTLALDSGMTAQGSTAAPPRRLLGPPVPKPLAANGSEIPVGTKIVVRMIDSVDSEVNSVGQTFKASVVEPVVIDGKTVVPAGADVVTRLVELKEPGRSSGGRNLTLDLVSITVGDKKLEVTSEGATHASRSRTGERRSSRVLGAIVGAAAGAGIGGAVGAIGGGGKGAAVGAIDGGGKGAVIGAASGAGAGTGTRVRIPSETRLTFTLQQPVGL